MVSHKVCSPLRNFSKFLRVKKLLKFHRYPRRSIVYLLFTSKEYLQSELKGWNFPWNITTTIPNIWCRKMDGMLFPLIDIAKSENFLTTLCTYAGPAVSDFDRGSDKKTNDPGSTGVGTMLLIYNDRERKGSSHTGWSKSKATGTYFQPFFLYRFILRSHISTTYTRWQY
jgi:hypothetical protein